MRKQKTSTDVHHRELRTVISQFRVLQSEIVAVFIFSDGNVIEGLHASFNVNLKAVNQIYDFLADFS